MADDEDTPMEQTPIRTEDNSSDSDSESDSDETQVQPVQWLATGREKRKTAGNRLNSLLQAEEPDDELELLFAEDEDDAGFEDEEADSDVQMDSSDDDEDQGPTAGADDLEGEKELQRQNKVEAKAKKKKANLIPKIFKKKLKFDPTVPQAPAPRPKKKSERASWLPTVEDAPTRASAREATQRKKTELIGDLVEREERRKKQLASMEKAAKKKEAAKKPAMTQEDRLREAARVEKQNAKSLSRWEEAEQLREEEQKAKLAALTNRQLNGPVITWWSGKGEYLGGKLKKVGKVLEIEDPKEKSVSRKRKAAEMEADSEIEKAKSPKPALHPPMVLDQAAYDRLASTPATELKSTATPTPVSAPTPAPAPTPSPAPPKSTPLAPPNFQMPPQSGPAYQSPLAPPPSFLAPPPALAFDGSHPLPGFHPPLLVPHSQHPGVALQPQPRLAPYQSTPFSAPPVPAPAPPQPPPPPAIEHTVRNYLILSNFDETAIKDKNVQTQILFGRKFTKVQKTTPTQCAIFSYPAKFRDPVTGLPYCNTYAYKEIQKLRKGDYKWSGLLGAYVGQGTYAARGVPPRFMGGIVKAGGLAAPTDSGSGNVNKQVDGVAGATPS